MVLVPAQSTSKRLSAKGWLATYVQMAEHRVTRGAPTAIQKMSGAVLVLIFVWARKRRKEVGSLFRMQIPRVCAVWNGEVLGMFPAWICMRAGAQLLRIGRRVFEAAWIKWKEIRRWCRPPVPPHPHNGSLLSGTGWAKWYLRHIDTARLVAACEKQTLYNFTTGGNSGSIFIRHCYSCMCM